MWLLCRMAPARVAVSVALAGALVVCALALASWSVAGGERHRVEGEQIGLPDPHPVDPHPRFTPPTTSAEVPFRARLFLVLPSSLPQAAVSRALTGAGRCEPHRKEREREREREREKRKSTSSLSSALPYRGLKSFCGEHSKDTCRKQQIMSSLGCVP